MVPIDLKRVPPPNLYRLPPNSASHPIPLVVRPSQPFRNSTNSLVPQENYADCKIIFRGDLTCLAGRDDFTTKSEAAWFEDHPFTLEQSDVRIRYPDIQSTYVSLG